MRTRKPADYLRELHINAVNAGIDSVSIPVDILDQIIEKIDKADSLMYNARNILNQAIETETEVKE